MGAYEHYLAHHGVKGQRWGHRRYQNEDGTLTAEGRARYAKELETYAKADTAASIAARKNRKNGYMRSDTGIIRNTIAGGGGTRALANWRTRRFAQKMNDAQKSMKELEKNRKDMMKDKDARTGLEAITGESVDKTFDREKKSLQKKYDKYDSKLKAQSKANADLKAYRSRTSTGKLIAQNYLLTSVGAHRYRKMRARGNGRLTSLLGAVDGTGLIRGVSNKRKYGKWVIHDAMKKD